MNNRLEQIKKNTGFIWSADTESVESADVKLSDYEWLIEQVEKAQEQQREMLELSLRANPLYSRRLLISENKRLREALAFYADSEKYYEKPIGHGFLPSEISEDDGDIAREALEANNNAHHR